MQPRFSLDGMLLSPDVDDLACTYNLWHTAFYCDPRFCYKTLGAKDYIFMHSVPKTRWETGYYLYVDYVGHVDIICVICMLIDFLKGCDHQRTKERTKETQELASSSCWRSWALAWARPAHKITKKHYL